MLSAKNVFKLALAAAVIVCIGLFFFLPLNEYLSFEYLQQQRNAIVDLYLAHPILFIATYIAVYVVLTGLSIPSATLLTLIGGAVFGTVTGTVVVLSASTLGAICAFVLARYVLRDYVQEKFSKYLGQVNRGVAEEGAFYLFGLRVVPVVPYFVVNFVMALTPIRLWTYYWVTQLGMLPGTVLYVNSGKELGKLQSASGILSWTLILSLVALGLFPLVAKKLVDLARSRIRKSP
ncbi:MAG: TVP38/TMEM64 family protein [Gammaproteobacteria bacterium]|nr:TVP38/TMEM64 family protein [Gammaproteobacteria bacterium]MYC24593.1 TVP38/TMEM64 family protein [Gammaproteobacteria bacterium]